MTIKRSCLLLFFSLTLPLLAQSSIITIKQGSIQAEIFGPNVLEADKIYTIHVILKNTGNSVLYNVMVTPQGSKGLSILSWQPNTIGTLSPSKNYELNVTFYTKPDSSDYQTITFEIIASYPDGSNITIRFYKGFIVKSQRTSTVLLKVNTPVLCIGKWNDINLTISVKGNYSISNVRVEGTLVSCNGKTYDANIACVNIIPSYIGYIPANKDVNSIVRVYVSPKADINYPISLKFTVNYNELGHIMTLQKNVSTMQSFVLTYCSR